MKQNKADLKAALIAQYSEALDVLLEENETLEDFADLEEAVSQLAERTLPRTLSTLQASKDFPP
jgi:DNA-binding HxlR family transcriptional regulator